MFSFFPTSSFCSILNAIYNMSFASKRLELYSNCKHDQHKLKVWKRKITFKKAPQSADRPINQQTDLIR